MVKKVEYDGREQFEISQPAAEILDGISNAYHGEIYNQLAEKRYAVGPVFAGRLFLRGNKICYSPTDQE